MGKILSARTINGMDGWEVQVQEPEDLDLFEGGFVVCICGPSGKELLRETVWSRDKAEEKADYISVSTITA